jgi:type I restriction enzyme S subunit
MKYDKYKPSGIEWLGDIPNDWEVKRLKSLGDIRYGLGQPPKQLPDGLPIIRATNVSFGKITPKNMLFVDPNDLPYDRNPILKTNDIIVVRSGAYTGDSAIIPLEYNGSVTGYDMVYTAIYVDPKFISYSILSDYVFKDQLVMSSLRAAQPHLNKEELGGTLVCIPNLVAQKAITNFLDNKCDAIDKKISLLTQKAKFYKEYRKSLINETICKGLDKNVKLKDSGIDWMGNIPKDWKLRRLKDCCNLFTGNSISDKSIYENKQNSIDYVSTKDIDFETGSINYDNGVYIPIGNKEFKIAKKHSILICLEGANAGKKIGFTEKDICFVNKLCSIKSFNKNATDKYLYYYTLSPLFEKQFFSILNGLIGGVPLSSIKYFNIILPSKIEQEEIATYLDKKTKTIDKIVSNINTQIKTLKELRKTLINNVVTGKVKVINNN